MAKIVQHRPNFFEGFPKGEKEFSSIDELFEIDFVKDFSNLSKTFHRYSIDDSHSGLPCLLMAEYSDGYSWLVVGFIDDREAVKDLPTWRYKER